MSSVPSKESSSSDTRGLKIALIVSLFLVGLQLGSYFLTNFLALLAAAYDSMSDVVISTFLLLSVFISRKPADEGHMFGHGRAQNVAALIAATMLIFWLSLTAFQEAIPKFFGPDTGAHQNFMLAVVVTVISILAYSIPLADLLRRRASTPAIKTQIIALLEMEVAFTAVLIGIVLVDSGYPIADPIVSVFVASIIAVSGVYLLRQNVDFLLGKTPDKDFLENVKSIAMSADGVLGVHDLKGEVVGPGIVHAGFHIEVERGTPIEEADRIAEEIQEKIGRETGCTYCMIHVDPKD